MYRPHGRACCFHYLPTAVNCESGECDVPNFVLYLKDDLGCCGCLHSPTYEFWDQFVNFWQKKKKRKEKASWSSDGWHFEYVDQDLPS